METNTGGIRRTNHKKEDIIDDPGKRDEKNIVQDPLNEPMDVNYQGKENAGGGSMYMWIKVDINDIFL